MLVYPVLQAVEIHGTGGAGYFPAPFVDGEGGDTTDLVLRGKLLFLLGINLGYPDFWFKLGRGLFENRGHHFAGATPRRPEIHQHRDIAFRNMLVEVVCIQLEGLADKQVILAFTTLAAPGKFFGRNPVSAVAMWANDM